MNEEELKKEAEQRYKVYYGKDYTDDKWTHVDTLKTIAGFILVLGIIATIICAFVLIYPKVDAGYNVYGHHYSDFKREFSWSGLAYTFVVLLSTLLTWSFMRVVADIHDMIQDIRKEIKRKH